MNNYKRMLQNIGTMEQVREAVHQHLDTQNLTSSEKEFINSEIELMMDDMCDKMAVLFSNEEVQALADFYETDAGKKLIAKTGDLVRISTEVMEKYMLRLMRIHESEFHSHDISVFN